MNNALKIIRKTFSADEKIVIIIFILSSLIFVWSNRFLPLQDYPDWLFQGFIFSELIKSNFVHFSIAGYPVPNSLSTYFLGLLNFVFSPEISGKIILSALLLIFPGSLIYFFKYFEKKKSFLILLIFALTFNNSFFKGNINFLFGLSFLFVGIAYILRKNFIFRNSDIFFISILSIVIFFSHGVIFFLWLLINLLFYILYYKRGRILNYYLSFIPSFILLILYFINNNISNLPGSNYTEHLSLAGLISFKFHSFIDYFSVFQQFFPFYQFNHNYFVTILSGIENLLLVFLILFILFLLIKKRFILKSKEFILILFAALLLIVFIASPNYILGVHNPGQRFLFPAVFILIALSISEFYKLPGTFQSFIKLLLIVIFITQILYLHFYVKNISNVLENNFKGMEAVLVKNDYQNDFRNIFTPDYEWALNYSANNRYHQSLFYKFIPDVNPFSRLPYYINIKYKTYASIFPTGIISAHNKKIDRSIENFKEMTNKPDCLIVFMGSINKNKYVADFLQSEYNVIFHNKYYFILKKM